MKLNTRQIPEFKKIPARIIVDCRYVYDKYYRNDLNRWILLI